jgi:serine/threonine protein kinase
MVSCRFCSTENSDSGRFCSECGAALKDEYAPTEIPVSGDSSSLLSSSSDSHHGRFLPGTKIADRYRIVSLVGKGGMGEVYRADDLKLGHTVALKFLPKELADDPQRMEYFHTEVRLTRQISHPSVCRVYDIGEADGQLFLSMEYIDGEDLRVLLRRIGKLPQDKGIQIAQQLCAGLAAAHDRGVLHRDLKPANIMLDGRGQVRITDFGLAKLAEERTEGEIAGTPAYMAPEQLTRGEATIQSDLYALGLILYELFSGVAARKPGSIPELIRANEVSSLSQTLQLPGDIDPAVQRAISRCLEREPHERPISAKAVAASLPGVDPLAAALAAGETPSPELVAAAGESGLLSLKTATICLGVAIAGLSLLVWQRGAVSPTADLKDFSEWYAGRARNLFVVTGVDRSNDLPRYEKYQFDFDQGAMSKSEDSLQFWYRSSPTRLFPEETLEQTFRIERGNTLANPPPLTEGMASVILNRHGELRELCVVDRWQQDSQIAREEDEEKFRVVSIDKLFATAGLKLTLHSSPDSLEDGLLPFPADEVLVYGPEDIDFVDENPDRPTIARVILGRLRGTVVYFHIDEHADGHLLSESSLRVQLSPWRAVPEAAATWSDFRDHWKLYRNELENLKKHRAETAAEDDLEKKDLAKKNDKLINAKADGHFEDAWNVLEQIIERWAQNLSWTLSLLILPVTMVLAWRNTVLGRSDRRVAWRVAVFMFCVVMLKTRLNYGLTLEMLRTSLQLSVGVAFRVWVYYLALEPILRKFWPGSLTVWSRAMTGRWRDPSLGRTLLVSAMMGTLVPLLYILLRGDLEEFRELKLHPLSGNVALLAILLQLIEFLSNWGLYVIIVLVICRFVVHSDRVSLVVAPVMLITFWQFENIATPNSYTIVLVVYYTTLMFLLLRFGIVATFTFLFCHHLMVCIPFTNDLKGPDLAPTIFAVTVVLAIAGYGFYASVGGRTYFASLFSADSRHSSTS